MKPQLALRCCLAAVLTLLLAQLMHSGILLPVLLSLQTGRTVSAVETTPAENNSIASTQTTQHSEDPAPSDAVISFSDLSVPAVNYSCDYRPDLSVLLRQDLPLDWSAEGPLVLIVHTHTTESYIDFGGDRSLNETENMLAIGDEVARVLELGGISVIHDRTLHDHPDYNSAYSAARATIQSYLAQYPSIQLVLDLHRDASDGTVPLTTSATVGGQTSSQLMMVVGTDAGGNSHPNWQENLSLALKLTALLEQEYPGITRPVNLRSQRFNMDLCSGSLLVEVGASGDTQEQAILAANALARTILRLLHT